MKNWWKKFRQWQKQKPQNKKQYWLQKSVIFLICAFIISFISGSIFLGSIIVALPNIEDIEKLTIAESTIIYDREGNELYKIHGEENRTYIPLSEFSPFVVKATLAIEDKDFYKHPGFDLSAIMRCAIGKLHGQGCGGSTITQQLIKNLLLTPEQTPRRKITEIILAWQLENRYSKDKILELYLNQIPYGSNAYGTEMASKTFFDKSAKDLSLLESAILASIPQRPSYFSPYGSHVEDLLGICKADEIPSEFENPENTTEAFTLSVKASKRVWLRVNTDQKERQEMTLNAGEVKTFSGTSSLGFLFGSTNVEISYLDLPFNALTSTSIEITPETVSTFLKNPELLEQKIEQQLAQQKSTACESMNDRNYLKGRKDLVLSRMLEDGSITAEELQDAWKKTPELRFKKYVENIRYPHFVMYVRDYLEKRYGKEVLEQGGLKVKTTIDPNLQDKAQDLMDKNGANFERLYGFSNLALLSANPKTGEILTMIGSRNYWDENIDGNVNVTLAPRQPGSSFKPFIYAALFNKGYGAGTVFWDVPTKFGKDAPNNSDGQFLGPIAIRQALAWSRNITAIKAYFAAGEEDAILDYLNNFGLGYLKEERDQRRETNSSFSYGWPISLGSVEVPLYDMVQGYAVFANGGIKQDLTPILEIQDKNGNILEKFDDASLQKKESIDPQVAYMINNILADAEARPAGSWRTRLTVPKYNVAVKTGTSNKRMPNNLILPSDNWTIGYSPNLITGVWGGNNDGKPLKSQAFGLNSVGAVWKDFMMFALQDSEVLEFPVPEGIAHTSVSKLSGKLTTADTPDNLRLTDIFPSFGVPKEYDTSLSKVKIDTRNGLLANDDCPPALVAEKTVFVPQEIGDRPEWNNSIYAWLEKGSSLFTDIVPKAPTEVSPLCIPLDESQKPKISIKAPVAFGEIARGKVNVVVEAQAVSGVDRVEYFIGDRLLNTASVSPYTGVFDLPASYENGQTLTLKARVYDRNQFATETSVEVRVVSSDTTDPVISLINPSSTLPIPLDTSVLFEANAYDDKSSIAKVEFFLDGQNIGNVTNFPYRLNIKLNSNQFSAKTYQLQAKATDAFGNTSSTNSSVTLTNASGQQESDIRILQPQNDTTVSVNTDVSLQYTNGNHIFSHLSLLVQYNGGTSTVLDEQQNISPSQVFVSSWKPTAPGTYELFLKATSQEGELSYSPRVKVVAQ